MLKVLLVKTSSLGDVVHNLPVVTDIRTRFPQARIDWAVEEAYAPLVRLHPAVARVIPVAIRRWRSHLLAASTWSQAGALRRLLREDRYDAIIDTQGLIKSALLARVARGRRHGFDAQSAREPMAARLYDVCHPVSGGQHAVARNRMLAACSLGYRVEPVVHYGISVRADSAVPVTGAYAVLLHSTSRADKLWSEDSWGALGRELQARGLRCVLPWGSEDERIRSERIASFLDAALVPDRMAVADVSDLLGRAEAVVGVDTGLTHLAAALGVPVAAVYVATDPALTGVYGADRARNLGGKGSTPEAAEVVAALRELGVF